jgi:hypothetical protein
MTDLEIIEIIEFAARRTASKYQDGLLTYTDIPFGTILRDFADEILGIIQRRHREEVVE